MALSFTELLVMPGLGDKKLAVYEVTGDGETVDISVETNLKLTRVTMAWTANVDNSVLRELATYSGTSNLSFHTAQPLDNGRKHLLFAIGW